MTASKEPQIISDIEIITHIPMITREEKLEVIQTIIEMLDQNDNVTTDIQLCYVPCKGEPEIAVFIKILYDECKLPSDKKNTIKYKAFERIVCSAIAGIRDGGQWVRYSRHKEDYHSDKICTFGVGYNDVIRAVKRLTLKKYVNHKLGNKDTRNTENNYQSAFIATSEFYRFIRYTGIDLNNAWRHIVSDDGSEKKNKKFSVKIRTEGETTTHLDIYGNTKTVTSQIDVEKFANTDKYEMLEIKLNNLNNLIYQHTYKLHITNNQKISDNVRNWLFDRHKDLIGEGPLEMRLNQIFNNAPKLPTVRDKSGVERQIVPRYGRGTPFEANTYSNGRYYNDHQNMPSWLRQYITIDGNATIELDYQCHHLRMIYAITNTSLPPTEPGNIKNDLYYLDYTKEEEDKFFELIGRDINRDLRKTVKRITNRMINTGDDNQLVFNIVKDLYLSSGFKGKVALDTVSSYYVNDIVKRIESKHAAIKHHFYKKGLFPDKKGQPRCLQNYDKDLCGQIMLKMLKMGIGIFAVHDSFIVPKTHEKQLHQAMTETFKNHTMLRDSGITPEIDEKISKIPDEVANYESPALKKINAYLDNLQR